MFVACTTTLIGSARDRGRTASTVPGRTPVSDEIGKPPIDATRSDAVVEVGMTVGLSAESTAAGKELPLKDNWPTGASIRIRPFGPAWPRPLSASRNPLKTTELPTILIAPPDPTP